MSEKNPHNESITFDPGVVANRMELLAQVKPMAYETYMLQRAAGIDPDAMVDFSKPVPRAQLAFLNRIFDIDAVDFFTATDEDFVNIIALRLRPEED